MLGHLNSSHFVVLFSSSGSILANLGLIFLIAKYSRPEFGFYKYLMMLFATFNVIFPLFHLILMPGLHVYGYAFSFFIATPLATHISQKVGECLLLYWCILYNKQLALIVFHFLYRYIVVCRFHLIPLFKKWSIRALLILFFVADISIWTWFFESQTWALNANRWYLKEEFSKVYGIDTEKASIYGPLFKLNDTNGHWKYLPYNVVCYTVLMALVAYKFIIMVWFTVNIHNALKYCVLSRRAKQLQYDLFRALIGQTICPFILAGVPCFLTNFCALTGIYLGYWCNYFFVMISAYPLLDAFSMTYFVRDYRRVVFTKIGERFSRYSNSYVEDIKKERSSRQIKRDGVSSKREDQSTASKI